MEVIRCVSEVVVDHLSLLSLWRMRGVSRSLRTEAIRALQSLPTHSLVRVQRQGDHPPHSARLDLSTLGCLVTWPETMKQFCCNSSCQLSDGKWFICGGDPCISQIANVAAIIDRTNDFAVRNLPPMAVARHMAFVCELPGGRILVGGGTIRDLNARDSDAEDFSDNEYYSSSFEVFDVASNQWSTLAELDESHPLQEFSDDLRGFVADFDQPTACVYITAVSSSTLQGKMPMYRIPIFDAAGRFNLDINDRTTEVPGSDLQMLMQATGALHGNRFLQCGGTGDSSTGPTIVDHKSVSYSDRAQMFTPKGGWVTIAPMKVGSHRHISYGILVMAY